MERTHQNNHTAEDQEFRILEPHLASHTSRTASKSGGLVIKIICLVDEKLDTGDTILCQQLVDYGILKEDAPFASTEDLLDVLYHNVLDIIQLVLSAFELILGWSGGIRVHQSSDCGGKVGSCGIG